MILRPTISDDLDYVLAAEQHEENRDFVRQWTRQQHQAAIDHADALHLIIESGLPESTRFGYVMLSGVTDCNQSILIQRIVITDKGKGYGKAALKLIQQLAFEQLQANRLWLDVKDFNLRAQAVYRSTGFVVEGVMRESLKTGKRFESLIIMSMLKSEYFTDQEG